MGKPFGMEDNSRPPIYLNREISTGSGLTFGIKTYSCDGHSSCVAYKPPALACIRKTAVAGEAVRPIGLASTESKQSRQAEYDRVTASLLWARTLGEIARY